MTEDTSPDAAFDTYAHGYDTALEEGLAVSGEGKLYFARERVRWLAACLRQLKVRPAAVMDFGCGTGTTVPLLLELPGVQTVVGVDASPKTIEIARGKPGVSRGQFLTLSEYQPRAELDLVYCNGVFHHIPVEARASALSYVCRSLRQGGLFAFWENNPWNPGTRYVMSRIPFDRDAVTLTQRRARELLKAGGFDPIRTDFLFIFPRALRWFRGLEPLLSRWPVGAQYEVLARKP